MEIDMARTITDVVTLTCDICGTVLEEPGVVAGNVNLYKRDSYQCIDLCPEHMEKLEQWVVQEKSSS
jgi:hypothetical protein